MTTPADRRHFMFPACASISARAMSDPRKLPPDEAWDALTNMAVRDEAERAKALPLVARIKGQAPGVQGSRPRRLEAQSPRGRTPP